MSNIEGYGCAAVRPLSRDEINDRKEAVYSRDLSEPFKQFNDDLGTSVDQVPRGRAEYDDSQFEDVNNESLLKGEFPRMMYPFETTGQIQYDEPYNPNEKLYLSQIPPNEPAPKSEPAIILNAEMEIKERKSNYLFWIIVFIILALLIWALNRHQ